MPTLAVLPREKTEALPTFGQLVRSRREVLDLTVKLLAKLTGIDVRALKRTEAGEHLPQAFTVEALSGILGLATPEMLALVKAERRISSPRGRRALPLGSDADPPGFGLAPDAGFAKATAQFLDYIESVRGYSFQTVRSYRQGLRQATTFFEAQGLTQAEALTSDAVRDWLRHLVGKGLSVATRSQRLNVLRSFLKFMGEVGGLTRNVAQQVYGPRHVQPLPRWLTIEEAARLLDAPYEEHSPEAQARDRAMLELLYSAGLRVAELVGLDLGDVDFAQQVARVLGKGSKERVVPVGKKALEALAAYLAVRGIQPGPLFLNLVNNCGDGRRLSTRSVRRMLAERSKAVLGKVVNPHALRHSMASHLLDRGAGLIEIASMLGHVSVVTTQKYTHLTVESLRRVYMRAHPRARQAPVAGDGEVEQGLA